MPLHHDITTSLRFDFESRVYNFIQCHHDVAIVTLVQLHPELHGTSKYQGCPRRRGLQLGLAQPQAHGL